MSATGERAETVLAPVGWAQADILPPVQVRLVIIMCRSWQGGATTSFDPGFYGDYVADKPQPPAGVQGSPQRNCGGANESTRPLTGLGSGE
jgi:hypothetical protein